MPPASPTLLQISDLGQLDTYPSRGTHGSWGTWGARGTRRTRNTDSYERDIKLETLGHMGSPQGPQAHSPFST